MRGTMCTSTSPPGEQRDTDTKVLHVHLFESAVYLFISGKQAWVSKASESHSREPELLFFLQHIKTNVDIIKRDKKDRDSSFVTQSAALPKDLVSVTELQSRFFWSFGFVSVQGSFPYPLGHACGGSYLCINSLNCLKLVSGSLPCTSFRYRHDPHHHHTWALFSGVIPDTSWWGREVLLSLFWDRELRY